MRPRRRRAGLVPAALVAALVASRAGAADVEPGPAPPVRGLATYASRETVVGAQAASARGAVRWRLRTLRGLAVAGAALDGATRARALDAGTRALARELAEARSLAAERDRARAEGAALAEAARAEAARAASMIGAPPALVLPVTGAVLARFGVAPDRATGLVLPRAGLRLAATPAAPVRAPLAGRVALVVPEAEGAAVVIEDGAGWTAIASGLDGLRVVEGQRVSAGEPLGVVAGTPVTAAAVGFEVWRGRRPVDPLLFVVAPAGPAAPGAPRAALADPPSLP